MLSVVLLYFSLAVDLKKNVHLVNILHMMIVKSSMLRILLHLIAVLGLVEWHFLVTIGLSSAIPRMALYLALLSNLCGLDFSGFHPSRCTRSASLDKTCTHILLQK